MAVVPFTNGRIFFGQINLSAHANQGTLEINAQELDVSPIQATWDQVVMGRKHVELAASGFWEAGTNKPDGTFALLGTSGTICTLLPDGAEGGVGYTFRGVPTKYSLGGPAGGVIPFSLLAKGDTARAVRGTILRSDAAATTGSGNGTAYQLGAVSATQRVYAAVHILAVSGTSPTLDITIDHGATQGGSYSSAITPAQYTAVGSDWQSAAGAITDTWWRIAYAVGGSSSPTVTAAIVIAIA